MNQYYAFLERCNRHGLHEESTGFFMHLLLYYIFESEDEIIEELVMTQEGFQNQLWEGSQRQLSGF